MDTGGVGGTLDGAGLAPAGQCSDNVDELGNEYVRLSHHSLYLNMLDISVVKSCFVAIFLMEETFFVCGPETWEKRKKDLKVHC